MAFMFSRLLTSIGCYVLFCTQEYPSDPLASQRVSLRSGRVLDFQEDRFNNVENGYDFSKGSSNPIVSTKSGKLEGYVMTSIKGRSIYAFEGVPYAETPAGKNRFELAIPKLPWSGVRPAKKPGDFCLQMHLFHFPRVLGSEDCLFVNVYVPSESILDGETNLPVIVWFHGGSWFFGAGSEYGPSYLLEHNVILVTVNYRLGVLGFLSTGDEHMPGNLGLKDQRSSLKWVHENIANFGGDPGLVTIAGQSSGAASVHLHMLSNSSREYFSGSISMSGNAYCPWTIMNSRARDARNRRLSRATNCPLSSSREFVNCLRKIDARVLTRSYLVIWDVAPFSPPVPLGAVIEDDRPGAFLTEHPDETYAGNRVAPVPWINSRTTEETQIVYAAIERLLGRGNIRTAVVTRGWRYLAPSLLDYKHVAKNPDQITDKVLEFYLGKNFRFSTANFTAISEAGSDRTFGYAVHKSSQLHSQVAPTYSYLYGYQGSNSVAGALGLSPQELGISHIDDLGSFFNMSDVFAGYKTTDPEYAVVKLMTSMMYNFALNRVPLFTDENGDNQNIWEPVTDPRKIKLLYINRDVRMISEPSTQRLKFWETLGLEDMKPFIPID